MPPKKRSVSKKNEGSLLYGRLVEMTGDGILRFTADKGIIRFANKGLFDILGLSTDLADIEGKKIGEIFLPAGNAPDLRKLAAKKRSLTSEIFTFKTSTGKIRCALLSAMSSWDPVSGKDVVDCVLRDITQFKKASIENERLISIMNNSTDLIAIFEANGRLSYLNQTGRNMLDIAKERPVEKINLFDHYADRSKNELLTRSIKDAFKKGAWDGDLVMKTSKGREFISLQIMQSHKGISGDIEFISLIARNIERRKAAEEEAKRLNWESTITSECNDSIGRATNEQGLLLNICRTLIRKGGYRSAWIGFIDGTEKRIKLASLVGADKRTLDIERYDVGSAIDKKLPMIRDDIGLFPLISKGEALGVLGLHSDDAASFSKREVSFLKNLSYDITKAALALRAEKALELSTQEYCETINSLTAAIHVIDRNFKITFVNIALWKLNYRRNISEAILGRDLFEIYPELGEKTRKEYQEIFERGTIVISKEKMSINDKELLFEVRKTPVFENGKVIKVVTAMVEMI